MTIENVRTVFRGRIIVVNVETVRLPNGHVTDLEIVHHPGGAAVVAVDRAGQRLPDPANTGTPRAAGYGNCRPGSSNPRKLALETARRELVEEAGTSAHSWQSLGQYVSSPGVFTEIVHLYLAQELDSVKKDSSRARRAD